jgi:recombination protein RecT
MTASTTTSEIAKRDDSAAGMVKHYRESFTAVLPSHIKADTWVRVAQGALKKGPPAKNGRGTQLEAAAQNNIGAFLSSLLDAARLGLEPGTEQYYLTPRWNGKTKKEEILGIVGWQGYVEMMYRAGAISSVVAECVYEHDRFAFSPGRDEIPHHDIDWDADDRGQLRLVYAFARMKDGATSRVVVLNRAAIERIKLSSQGADSDRSPWKQHEPAMWLKSAVRQLAKWVPTSSEYIREQLRAERDVANEQAAAPSGFGPSIPQQGAPTFDVSDLPEASDAADVIDGEIVDPDEYLDAAGDTSWPETAAPGAKGGTQ